MRFGSFVMIEGNLGASVAGVDEGADEDGCVCEEVGAVGVGCEDAIVDDYYFCSRRL